MALLDQNGQSGRRFGDRPCRYRCVPQHPAPTARSSWGPASHGVGPSRVRRCRGHCRNWITVTKDLTGIAAGTTLTLYFDLLGFGATSSSVTVNVRRSKNQAPERARRCRGTCRRPARAESVTAAFTDVDANGHLHVCRRTTTDGTKGTVIKINNDGTFTYDPNGAFYQALKARAIFRNGSIPLYRDSMRRVRRRRQLSWSSPFMARTRRRPRRKSLPPRRSTALRFPSRPRSRDVDSGDTRTFTIDTTTATWTKGQGQQ